MTTTTKNCTTCKISKPLSDFYESPRQRLGVRNKCKACCREAVNRARDKKRNNELTKIWASGRKEIKRAYDAERYKEKRAEITERVRQYGKSNRHLKRDWDNRRRARLQGNGVFFVSDKDRKRLDSKPCQACNSRNDLTDDHLIPVARGGTHGIGNLVRLCAPCNSSKGTMTWFEWKNSDRSIAIEIFGKTKPARAA